ncbi:leucine-rich repeat domain-containing protein [Paenibacillus sp. FSL H8-0034]|uniref:leucine-rich repeat domain-containing protein n=1 Tax=Paenibacillus sp. FSL H8-0034 TaxID=2954671 RepID=UPI0030FA5F3A
MLATLSLILTVSLLFSSIATASGVIEDPNLEKVIREKLNFSDKPILAADVSRMDKLLEYKPYAIKSLKGLEHATGLNQLLLIGNEIEDLGPLSGMHRMMFLYMNHNRISNLEPLKNMTRLINVDLDNNQVYDISPLNKATQLSVLRLESNPVDDISVLKDMKKLKGLNIANTSVTDIHPLAGLPLLEFLYLNDTEISDLTPLREMPSLHSLYLKNNPLTAETFQVIEELKGRNVRILDPDKSFNEITEKHIRVTLNGEELLFEQSSVLLN